MDPYLRTSYKYARSHRPMKLFLTTALLVLPLHAGPLTPLAAELAQRWPGNRTINLVFHGHSVPAGYQKTPDVKPFEAYPHLFTVALKKEFPNAVVNTIVTAIGGEDCVAGAARFDRDVLSHKPDLIFIDYALNDRRDPLPKVEEAWESMIASAESHHIPLILITPTGDSAADMNNPEDPLRQRADLIRQLAARHHLPLADVSAAWLSRIAAGTPQGELLSQPNHPNLAGNQLAADAISACFTKAASP